MVKPRSSRLGIVSLSALLTCLSQWTLAPCVDRGCTQSSADAQQPEEDRGTYFPTDQAFALDGFASTLDRGMYSAVLESMQEPPLCGNEKAVEEYRFLWVRTFHDIVAVRASRSRRTPVLHVRVLRGFSIDAADQDGKIVEYKAGELVFTDERILREEEWEKLVTQIADLDFWTQPTGEMHTGVDGAAWLLEGAKAGEYHAVSRWSPREGAFRQTCLTLLSMAQKDFGEIY